MKKLASLLAGLFDRLKTYGNRNVECRRCGACHHVCALLKAGTPKKAARRED